MTKAYWGVGLEWDARIEKDLFPIIDKLDCIEFIPENFFYADKIQEMESLEYLKKSQMPCLIHGVELSLASTDPLKEEHLMNMLEVASKVNAVNFSEHLSFTEEGGIEIGQLTPVMWSRTSVELTAQKIKQIQRMSPYPFLIENITNRFVYPKTELTETNYINQILNKTQCGLLLDVTNVYTNSINHKFDPYQWIDEIDTKFVQQIHLAGGEYDKDGVLQDSHNQIIFEEVWKLYEYAINQTGPVTTIIERTENIPDRDQLLSEVERARNIINEQQAQKLTTLQQVQLTA